MGKGERNYHPQADGGREYFFFLKCPGKSQEQGCISGVRGFKKRQSLLDEEF